MFGTHRLPESKVYRHLLFWCVCTVALTFLFAAGLPGYLQALKLVLMLLPVHIGYYYAVSEAIIPKFLYKRNFAGLSLHLKKEAYKPVQNSSKNINQIIEYQYSIMISATKHKKLKWVTE